jgi:hypothetical protein
MRLAIDLPWVRKTSIFFDSPPGSVSGIRARSTGRGRSRPVNEALWNELHATGWMAASFAQKFGNLAG